MIKWIYCILIRVSTSRQHWHSFKSVGILATVILCTVCSAKDTYSRFVLYLCGKCLYFYQIFIKCLEVNKHSIGKIVKYSLLPVTSCWCHISMCVNYGFYRQKQTFDKMFASQQGL